MANETLFSAKAADYAAGRPSYAPEAIAQIFSGLIRPGQTAADMGSGTGILSGEFLARGYEVYGVEPNAAMRREAERQYGAEPDFHSVAAPAEATVLPAGSIGLVTAASSFHWFDPERFAAECRRILTPEGQVCILANARVYDVFARRQHTLCKRFCPGFTSLTHGVEKDLARAGSFFAGGYRQLRVPFPLAYTQETFLARSLSSSYAPEPGTKGYAAYREALRALLEEMFPGGTLLIPNETVLLWGRP